MKEPIKHSSHSSLLTFILYSNNKLPSVFKINKKFFNLYLITPIITFSISIFIFIAIFNYNNIIDNFKKNKIIEDNIKQKKQINVLNQITRNKELTIKSLEKRLNTEVKKEGLSHFNIFKSFLGQKFITDKIINITNLTISSNGIKNINIKFKVNNLKQSIRISGYLYLFLKRKDTPLLIWPQNKTDSISLDYKKGEHFSASRFRPFDINIQTGSKLTSQNITNIKIYIFNKFGDLIHIMEKSYDITK